MVCFSRIVTSLALLWGVCLSNSGSGSEVNFESLLAEMTDRATLARLPKPAYQCKQFSSFDRRSNDPRDQSTWYANRDRSQFLYAEEKQGRTEHVMMDAQGPGAVVRMWVTWRGLNSGPFSDGTLRLYLDGSQKPIYEGPISNFVGGDAWVGAPLSQGVSPTADVAKQGHNLYLPIPYQKSMKITYSTDTPLDDGTNRGEALYYQINYRTYESGTDVQTFSLDQLSSAKEKLAKTQQQLDSGAKDVQPNEPEEPYRGTLDPGQEVTVFQSDSGPGAVCRLSVKISAVDLPQALRSTVLRLKFDGEQTVWVPVGDFFATGYKIRPHHTYFTHTKADRTMACAWVMPYSESVQIDFLNTGDQAVSIESCQVELCDWKWDDQSMHFHANWRLLQDLETKTNADADWSKAFDIDYVTIRGSGLYVGDTLTLFNGARRWWGEGDEKIYVDGESFPSHFGTGTEDYYGYAWCRPESFAAPFHAQPEGGGNLTGGFSVNSRYRMLDAIPFRRSLDFDMEVWHWHKTQIDFAPTTYYYGRPGATSDIQPQPAATSLSVKTRKPPAPSEKRVRGAIEGESLEVVKSTGGTTVVQASAKWGWSGAKQLWWKDANKDDELQVKFAAPAKGKYRVIAKLTKAPDYAEVQLAFNGQPVEGQFDRYHPDVATDTMVLGVFELEKENNLMTVRIVGQNPKALPRKMFGLDFLILEKAH